MFASSRFAHIPASFYCSLLAATCLFSDDPHSTISIGNSKARFGSESESRKESFSHDSRIKGFIVNFSSELWLGEGRTTETPSKSTHSHSAKRGNRTALHIYTIPGRHSTHSISQTTVRDQDDTQKKVKAEPARHIGASPREIERETNREIMNVYMG